ncbi:MAG: biotin/lipoate A/B protein ligase family protein [Acidobacteriota bacterium]|jgi:lipoate-protein ligase A
MLRRINDPPAPGAWNMAVDESLLWSCAGGADGFPCLRLYRWRPACLSLGFHQDAAGVADLRALEAERVDLVRRPTGGRAVLHDRELTYTLVASARDGVLGGPPMTGYRRISAALAAGLIRLGLAARLAAGEPEAGKWSAEPCFVRLSPAEVEVEGEKVIGSVQVRRGGCLLQHGSIPLRADPRRLARLTGATVGAAGGGVEDLLGRSLAPGELEDALSAGFEEVLGLPVRSGALDETERERARRLEASRYRTTAWNRGRPRRRLGEVAWS